MKNLKRATLVGETTGGGAHPTSLHRLANRGTRDDLLAEAREMLLGVQAPVVAVVGNHDLGFGPTPILTTRYGAGWANFARAFHPYLMFSLRLGGWEFVGFDRTFGGLAADPGARACR